MLSSLLNSINILAFFGGSCDVLGAEFTKILQEVFNWIQIGVPVLVIVLCSVDCATAVISQDEKAISGTTSKIIKRVVIGVAVFFVPMILNILLTLAGIATGTCKIGG